MMLITQAIRHFCTSTNGATSNEIMFGLPVAVVVSLGALTATAEVMEVESASTVEVLSSLAAPLNQHMPGR